MKATLIAPDSREMLSPVKNSRPFDYLYSQAKEIQDQCADFVVDDASLHAHYAEDTGCLNYAVHVDSIPKIRRDLMSKLAMSQLCAKIGVPASYIEKCNSTGRLNLAADNVNSWMEDYKKSLLLRTYKNRIRGVLSERYSVIDTPEIVDVLHDSIDGDKYSVRQFFMNEERFHARIVQNSMLDVPGEDLFAGLQIDSSDVGRSILRVQFFIFKQVCTNGMIIAKGGGVLFEQKHVGISASDFKEELVASLSNVPLLVSNAKELIQNSQKDSTKYRSAMFDQPGLQSFIDEMKLKTKLSDESLNKVVYLMGNSYGTSTWGLVNSITEVARDFTLERRLELEKIAGDMLSVA